MINIEKIVVLVCKNILKVDDEIVIFISSVFYLIFNKETSEMKVSKELKNKKNCLIVNQKILKFLNLIFFY